ncbi:hypothetical protein GCM10009836_60910 [Pseudonocardia ailaonensis]|uniref:Uncharacterized protein n=1 Tax=Pseudonocardia ailaonensis TaxID=367279 RepID=A0ABN2NNK4_9PSEU
MDVGDPARRQPDCGESVRDVGCERGGGPHRGEDDPAGRDECVDDPVENRAVDRALPGVGQGARRAREHLGEDLRSPVAHRDLLRKAVRDRTAVPGQAHLEVLESLEVQPLAEPDPTEVADAAASSVTDISKAPAGSASTIRATRCSAGEKPLERLRMSSASPAPSVGRTASCSSIDSVVTQRKLSDRPEHVRMT